MKWIGREHWHYDVKTYYWENSSTDPIWIPLGGGVVEGSTTNPTLVNAKEYFMAPYDGSIVLINVAAGGSSTGNVAFTYHKNASSGAVGTTHTTGSFGGAGGGSLSTIGEINDWTFEKHDKIFIKANPSAVKFYYNCTVVYRYIIT